MQRVSIAALVLAASAAAAADEGSRDWQVNFGLATDYVFRGITRTNQDPSVHGGIDYHNPDYGLYAGLWSSNTEFNRAGDDEAALETDFYGGFRQRLANGIGWDLGARYYYFPGQNADRGVGDLETAEVSGRLDYGFSRLMFTPKVDVGVAYSPDYFGEDGDGVYVDSGVKLALPQAFGLFTRVGYLDVEGDRSNPAGYDYVDYQVGVSKRFGAFDFDLTWHDTNHGCDQLVGQSACQALVFGVNSRW